MRSEVVPSPLPITSFHGQLSRPSKRRKSHWVSELPMSELSIVTWELEHQNPTFWQFNAWVIFSQLHFSRSWKRPEKLPAAVPITSWWDVSLCACLLSSIPRSGDDPRVKVSQLLFVRPFWSEGHMPKDTHTQHHSSPPTHGHRAATGRGARCVGHSRMHRDGGAWGGRVQRCRMAWGWKLMPLRQTVTSPCLTPSKVT